MLKFLVTLAFIGLSSAQLDDCPFTNDACPVDLDNAIEVFYFDKTDITSCQHKCTLVGDCTYFTMLQDGELTKCFLFKECDKPEVCNECVSGPQSPDYEPCLLESRATNVVAKSASPKADQTCETSVDNVLAIYYFDDAEDHSCKLECDSIPQCAYWTQFKVTEGHVHNKCFLFASCDVKEACPVSHDCQTMPSE